MKSVFPKLFLLLIITLINTGWQKAKPKTDSIAIYTEQKNPYKALKYSKKLSNQYLNSNKYLDYCQIEFKRGDLFEELNDTENSFNSYYAALKVAQKNKFKEKEIIAYCKIGNLHTKLFNFTQAKKNLYKAKAHLKKYNSIKSSKAVYQSLMIMKIRSESDSLKYYLEKVDSLTKISSNYEEKATNASNFFAYYSSIKDYPNAKKSILEGIEHLKKTNNKKLLGIQLSNLGLYYFEGIHDYPKAIEIYKKIIAEYPESEYSDLLATAYYNISISYENIKDFKKSLEYNNKYIELKEVAFSGKLQQISSEIETKYQLEKQQDLHKIETQNIINRQNRNLKVIYLLGTLFILLGGLSYFFFQNLKLKQTNKLKDIDSELQTKIISATIDGQELERLKISEVLHDNVSATLSSIGLHLSAFESSLNNKQINDLKKTRLLLKQAHDKVRDLSHELVPPLLVKFGLAFALRDLCDKNSNTLIKFNFNSELPRDKKFESDFETKVYYIISELFNNTIKHSKASDVNLGLKLIKNKLLIQVQDNGIGFNNKEITFGLGLTQIKARIKSLKGKIKIISEEKIGTTISIELPEQ